MTAAKSKRCWLLHRYGKWQDIYTGSKVRQGLGGTDWARYYTRQERRCAKCGKLQDRNVTLIL